jgi:hypothetical protein
VTLLDKIAIKWDPGTGAGGPGYSVFYGPALSAHMGNLRTFFDAFKGLLPTNYLITFPTTGYIINDVDGVAKGSWSVASQTYVQGAGGTNYVRPTGAHVDWRTGVLNTRGHQIKGRTFLVPLVVAAYGTGGDVSSASTTTLKNAADALVTGAAQTLYVYARHGVTKAGTAYPGTSAMVTTTNVPIKAAVLKSRRD